jgi:hypothetical protein
MFERLRMVMQGVDLLVVGLDVLVTDVLPLFLFEIGKHRRRKRGVSNDVVSKVD